MPTALPRIRATRRAAALAACLLLHAGLVHASPTRTDEQGAQDLQARVQAATQRLQGHEGQDRGAMRAMAAAIDDPQFDRLPVDERRSALAVLAWNTYRAGKPERARALYARATTLEDGDPDSWYQLALLEMSERQYPPAARALIVIAERWPELLPRLDEDYIHWIRVGLDPAAPERVALLQALLDANWVSPSLSSDGAWYDLAVARLEQGKPEAAVAPLKRVAMPELLVRVRSDRRFDALIDRAAWSFNVEQAARNRAAALEERARLRPDDLDVRVMLADTLLMLGENAQVLALADQVERAIAAPSDPPAFTDMEELRWLFTSRAFAYRRLGQLDQALAELERAARLGQEAGDTGQALNLADFQCRLGQRETALATVRGIADLTPYGEMVFNNVRLCAARLGRDTRGRDAALAYLRQHRGDAPMLYVEAELGDGDLDAAAGALGEALARPDKRGEALGWAQDTLRPAPLPGDMALVENRARLLARADVRAAIEAVGRIEHYRLYLDF